jgi:hypothetical protein
MLTAVLTLSPGRSPRAPTLSPPHPIAALIEELVMITSHPVHSRYVTSGEPTLLSKLSLHHKKTGDGVPVLDAQEGFRKIVMHSSCSVAAASASAAAWAR